MIGRDSQWARLTCLLHDVRAGAGSVIVVCGQPGSGKTTLLDALAEGADGLSVVRLRPTHAEQGLPAAGIVDLLHGLPVDPATSPETRIRALATLRVAEDPPRDPRTLGPALLALLAAAATPDPVLVLVDDVHLLDQVSARALIFAARRLTRERVALVLCADAHDAPAELEGFEQLHLGPLDAWAAEALLRRHAPRTASVRVAERLLGLADGNPCALVELPTCVTADQLLGARH